MAAGLRAVYGEEYSEERYKKYLLENWYSNYDETAEHEKSYMHEIENSGYSADGLQQLRAILGATGDFEYKPEEIQGIQYARYG